MLDSRIRLALDVFDDGEMSGINCLNDATRYMEAKVDADRCGEQFIPGLYFIVGKSP